MDYEKQRNIDWLLGRENNDRWIVSETKSSDRLKQEIDNEQICSSFNRLQGINII